MLFLLSADFFFKIKFSKNSLRKIIIVSNCLDPDQNRHFVGPDLGANCLQTVFTFIFAVMISKYAMKIVGMRNRQVPCVHGMQAQKQSTFNKFKSAQ